jgi:hypothetical protein
VLRRRYIAEALADAFRGGAWDAAFMAERAEVVVGLQSAVWIRTLADRLWRALPEPPPFRRQLIALILSDKTFRTAMRRSKQLAIVRPTLEPAQPPARAEPIARWNLPSLASDGDLAAWLGLGVGELAWFAGVHGGERNAGPGKLRHYRFVIVDKDNGNIRLLEAPRPRLRELQRKILRDILDRVPAHSSAHGFVRGRGIASFARPHVKKAMVLRVDLQSFFSSIPAPRIFALFSTLGFPERVARLLTGLTTIETPSDVLASLPKPTTESSALERRRLVTLLRERHLPQGAPTSPALANLCGLALDRRLDALALTMGATYTRYADDLVLSGGEEFARGATRAVESIRAIAREEGFSINDAKTRWMRASSRQRVAGVVVNEKLGVARDAFDRLKATLHNCAKTGPEAQNREGVADFRAHLLGKVAHVAHLDPRRGARLRAFFDSIRWDEQPPPSKQPPSA